MITQNRALELYEYKDGELFWKTTYKTSHVKIGDKAGSFDSKGYRQVRFEGKKVLMHRVIFLMHHGWLPDCIDHIDGNPLNNKIENLRAATFNQNSHNAKLSKANSSGIKGVSWHKRHGKWNARLLINRKMMNLGLFDSIDEAKKVVTEARMKFHGAFANPGF